MSGIDNLYAKIIQRLREYDLEPTEKRADSVFYTLMWEFPNYMNRLEEKDIDNTIMSLYNFRRYKNTRLARKLLDDIIKTTDEWIYVREYGDKK